MSFGYRISQGNAPDKTNYAIREFYFDDDGQVEGWTEDAFTPEMASVEEVKSFLEQQLLKAQSEDVVRMGDLNYEYVAEDIEWMQKGAGLEYVNITELLEEWELDGWLFLSFG